MTTLSLATHFYVLQIAIPSPLRRLFDYLPPDNTHITQWQIGIRVKVPFGRKEVVGILIAVNNTTSVPSDRLKTALALLDDAPLWPPALFKLLHWASNYYHHPVGEVFHHALPVALRTDKIKRRSKPQANPAADPFIPQAPLALSPTQTKAIEHILAGLQRTGVYLLDGITGSGKTEVYLQAITAVLTANQQALVLVPEISLTPQTVARFTERFAVKVAVLHSGLTPTERLRQWHLAKSGEAAIVIGTRSALFTPLANPGMIIVDEEHDLSFKQQEGFRYSARDLAVLRGQLETIPVVLGSATPSLESLQNAALNRYHYLRLPERAGTATLPTFTVLDIKTCPLDEGLSLALINKMHEHLAQGNQVLLFLNRRGYAPTLMCHDCGCIVDCKRCDRPLTLHHSPKVLRCHHCGSEKPVLRQCKTCGSPDLRALGLGTERIFNALTRLFPEHSAVRIDRDSTRKKGVLAAKLDEIQQGQHPILLGTQMLAKGHHFPKVTLVGILDADSGLFSADFRASERIGQLFTQVAGRAGRTTQQSEVLIQTYHPEHPLLLQLLEQGYHAFAQMLLQERTQAQLPPFAYLALLRAEAVQIDPPFHFLEQARHMIQQSNQTQVACFGPMPAPMERKAGRYRAQLLLQASARAPLQALLAALIQWLEKQPANKQVRWSLDVDPQEMA